MPFAELNFPNATDVSAFGINNKGDIVGTYLPSGGNGFVQGFLFRDGSVTTFNHPGAQYTNPLDINNEGWITGWYSVNANLTGYGEAYGFFHTIAAPGAVDTLPTHENDRGDIVGEAIYPGPNAGVSRAFIYKHGHFTLFAVPGSESTSISAINDSGNVTGDYVDGSGIHGFLLSHGKLLKFDVPGEISTTPTGMNNRGEIVGTYQDPTTFKVHGFLYDNGKFTTIDEPNATNGTYPEDINDKGQIVGFYYGSNADSHGFLLA
jgi:uncharacterized membrane protein